MANYEKVYVRQKAIHNYIDSNNAAKNEMSAPDGAIY